MKAKILISGKQVRFILDNGASANVMSRNVYKEISGDTKLKKLTMTKSSLFNKTELKPCGEVVMKVVNPKNKKKYKVRFVITKEARSPVLGLRAVQGMELITVNTENIATVSQEKENDVLQNYKDVFAGEVGKPEGKLHLEMDKEFSPVRMTFRKWPLTVKQNVKDDSDRLEKIRSC